MRRITHFFALLAATSMLFTGVGCNDNPDPAPLPPPLPDGAFTITLSNITSSSVKILVEPEDQAQTYYSHILAKKDFAKNWNSSVSALMTDYIAFLCEEHEMSKQEVAAELITTGHDEWDYNRLEPDTEYVVFAVGLNPEGNLTTTPVMKEFTALTLPPVVPVECTFDIRVSNITASRAQLDITPSNKQTPYFYDLIPVSLYPSGDATEFLTDFVHEVVYSVMDQQEVTFEEAVSMLAVLGVSNLDLTPGTLRPSTEYYVVAFGIDAFGRLTTAPKTQKFATPAIVPSSNTFTIDVEGVTATSALASITPSNNDPYYVNYFPKADLAGRTDEEILTAIQLQDISHDTNTGAYMLDASDRLFSGTEYEILVFGYNEGVTTAITRKSFTTLASGDPALCTFEFDIANEGHNAIMGVYPSDPSVFYIFDLVLKSEYTTDSAFTAGIEGELKELSKNTPIQTILLDLCARGPAEATIPVKSQQEYYAVIFALNMDGTAAGPVYKTEYIAKEQIVSTATAKVEVLKYYNGRELFAFDPVKYAGGAENGAYIKTAVTHSEDAVHWYAAIFSDDLSESSDAAIIKNLIDYGGGDKDTDHLEIWPWAYFFDVQYYGRDGIPNTLCAVAIDAEGNYGPIFKELFKPLTTGVSPTSEIIGAQTVVITGQAPILFKTEQSTASQSHLARLTRPSESGSSTHLMFAAPVAKTQIISAQATPVASLQRTEGLQNTGDNSRMFGHGKTLYMQ